MILLLVAVIVLACYTLRHH